MFSLCSFRRGSSLANLAQGGMPIVAVRSLNPVVGEEAYS